MAKIDKLDLYMKHKDEYSARRKPALVNLKRASHLTIAGTGGPGSDTFKAAFVVIYGSAFTIKMTEKMNGRDYAVCKLEAQWWGTEETPDFWALPRDGWNWKILIRTPDFITQKHLKAAVKTLADKGKGANTDKVVLEKILEGKCVQMLHVGPYDREGETMAEMAAFAEEQGLSFHGLHHEIYLSDPRRVKPEGSERSCECLSNRGFTGPM